MHEVYGLPELRCARCGVDYEPGIMYDITNSRNACTGMGANGLTDVPIKCMKCSSCGESRRMTTFQDECSVW
jgi:hypothetical protein